MDVSCIKQQGMSFVSVCLAIISIVTVVTSYVIAVVRGDVQQIFPYISDTGGKPPESCVFGQLLNITALLMFASAWIRYKQMEDISDKTIVSRFFVFWNRLGLVIAGCASLGLTMVANFQDVAVLTVHMIGAFFAFVGGVVYAAIHTWMSYKISPEWTTSGICRFRLFLTITGIAMVLTTYLSEIAASKQWKNHHVNNDTFKWDSKDGGYPAHLVSTFSEWILAATILTFFVSYFSDFKKVVIDLQMKQNEDALDMPKMVHQEYDYDVSPLNL